MAKDLNDSPEWVVIADDWVDIDDEMNDEDDHTNRIESKNESHDHVKSPVIAEENENTDNTPVLKVLTRYVDVPEDLVKFFGGKDVVMDIQIASGTIIQLTKAFDVEAKYRPVRVIGNLENVEKAEKLIKAVVALADAGGKVLLRKHDCDTSDYGHPQKRESWYQPHNYPQYPESWGPFQFDRKRSQKRTHGRR